MSRLSLLVLVLLGACADTGSSVAGGTLTIQPGDVVLQGGTAAPTQRFRVVYHGPTELDVSAEATFTLENGQLGHMDGNTFVGAADQAGSTTLQAAYANQSASAMIRIKPPGSFDDPDCVGCSFPPDDAPPCAGTAPMVVYPADGVLLPPNLESFSIHFLPGSGTQFEIDFANAVTDVRVNKKCASRVIDARGDATGGCALDLSPSVWDYLVHANRGGDPLTVRVRATTDGACATPSANHVAVAIAEQDVVGTIYYWKSIVGVAQWSTGGQIWRKDFGDAQPEEAVTLGAAGSGFCNGCHTLSRDGQRMAVNTQVGSNTDELAYMTSGIIDPATKQFIGFPGFGNGAQSAGFQSFSPDHTLYLGTSGDGTGQRWAERTLPNPPANQFFLWNGDTGQPAAPDHVTIGDTSARPTQPNWSQDGKRVVFVRPAIVLPGPLMWLDDIHVTGGSLWTMPHLGGGVFGTPTEILHSEGENNYYPSYSPDGSLIAFDRVPASGDPVATDSFANPNARLFLVDGRPGSAPVDCARANGDGALSNSWPRWAPFVQTYKGGRILWITFSSTRDYGFKVRNQGRGLVTCYPPQSPENATSAPSDSSFPTSCLQPQIWMAAIDLTRTTSPQSSDPSFPAFWLPFQDSGTHNHTAEWTTTVLPPPDGGTCIPSGADCTRDPNHCCEGGCTANGTCGIN